ncbi:uncharacterized protein [Clytia hemisphaerica]|uniref:uncharacterized protein n=1 Tax=Clytia hemisphaerica TaxID=252671 RepID=UPI0034D5D22C
MADGLMKRFSDGKVEPPKIIYTDRDCCSDSGPSKFQQLFYLWTLIVCLDIWHFMRRFTEGCTSESHPLYGLFLMRLSGCIFEWDEKDYDNLLKAKRAELINEDVQNPTLSAVKKAINSGEMARYCKRRTRGAEKTIEMIENLILSMTGATDSLGVPLFKATIVDVWEEQRRHVKCIQDPDGFQLYTQTGSLEKGGVKLPVYLCARGSTSLESFHHHLRNFIPGTSANAVNFQAYLLDGLARWNTLRRNAIDGTKDEMRCFDSKLVEKFNLLHLEVHGERFNEERPPPKLSDEIFGMEYLFRQNVVDALDKAQAEGTLSAVRVQRFDEGYIDNNIDDGVNLDSGVESDDSSDVEIPEELPPSPEDEENDKQDLTEAGDNDAIDSKGIPGWRKVDRLAKALIKVKGISVSNAEKIEIVNLFNELEDYDKRPITYKTIVKKPARGRFARKKEGSHVGVVEMKRAFLTGASPAFYPSKSRLVEAICIYLCNEITTNSNKSVNGQCEFESRWQRIVREYNNIRSRIYHSTVYQETSMTLFCINQHTLRIWEKDKARAESIVNLMQGRDPPGEVAVSSNLPETADHQIVESSLPPATFPEPQNRSGLLKFRKRKRPAESATQSKPPTQRPQQQQRESIPSYFAPPSIPQVRFSAQPQPRFVPFPTPGYPNIYQAPNPFQQSQSNLYQQTSPLYHSQPSLHPLFLRMASPFNSASTTLRPNIPPTLAPEPAKTRKPHTCQMCKQQVKGTHGWYKGKRPYSEWLAEQKEKENAAKQQ